MKLFYTMVAAFAFVFTASAGIITVPISTSSCDRTNESNNITGVNVLLTPVSVWGSGCWIGHTNTAVGGIVMPNTTITGTPTVIYEKRVFLPYANNELKFVGKADDTMSVFIENSLHPGKLLLYAANDVRAAYCVAIPIGCVEGAEATLSLGNTVLAQGWNTFWMPEYQLFGNGSGINFKITGTSTSQVPEPATMGLIGSSLIGIAVIRRKIAKKP